MIHRKKPLRTFVFVNLFLWLVACGQTGDLYLPNENELAVAESSVVTPSKNQNTSY